MHGWPLPTMFVPTSVLFGICSPLKSIHQCMGSYDKSKINWQRALDALPKTNLKPAEEVQKAQYEAGLKAASAALTKLENTVLGQDGRTFVVQGEGRMPWDLAAAIVPRLRVQRPTAGSPDLYSSVCLPFIFSVCID